MFARVLRNFMTRGTVVKVLVELFQKRRCSADVFACLSFGRAFSKARAGGGGGRLLAVATAKFFGGVSFCQAFSLRLFQPKKKRVVGCGEVHGYR